MVATTFSNLFCVTFVLGILTVYKGSSLFAESYVPNIFLRGGARTVAQQSVVICRVTIFDVLKGQDEYAQTSHRTICMPIVNNRESDIDTAVTLPLALEEEYRDEIHQGKFIVSIAGATIRNNGRLDVGENPLFTVINDSRFDHHKERHLQATGTKTVAIIRVSTSDSTPKYSLNQIQSTHFGSGINFVTQYDACSHGKIQWKLAENGVLDVEIPGARISDFAEANDTGASLVTALQVHMKQSMGYSSISDIADRVIICLPPGTGEWAAAAGVNHWRVQMNSDWCLSLSGTMHELGHTLGLNHASENGEEYADQTGYMSSGYTDSDWPRKCFNGANNAFLGWFSDKQIVWTNQKSIKLATFVDYEKTTNDEYVLVDIVGRFFLQFNVKKTFNNDTEENADKVTIHMTTGNGSNTVVLGSIGVGNVYHLTDPDVYIKACQAYKRDADVMVVAFGNQPADLCTDVASESLPVDPIAIVATHTISSVQANLPTHAPTNPPITGAPKEAPTVTPTDLSVNKVPMEAPINAPMDPSVITFPRVSPSDEPTNLLFTVSPKMAPTLALTDSSVTVQREATTDAPTDLLITTASIKAPTDTFTHNPQHDNKAAMDTIISSKPPVTYGGGITNLPHLTDLPLPPIASLEEKETSPPVVLALESAEESDDRFDPTDSTDENIQRNFVQTIMTWLRRFNSLVVIPPQSVDEIGNQPNPIEQETESTQQPSDTSAFHRTFVLTFMSWLRNLLNQSFHL